MGAREKRATASLSVRLTSTRRWQVVFSLIIERVFGFPRFETWRVSDGRNPGRVTMERESRPNRVLSVVELCVRIANFAVAWMDTAEMRGREASLVGISI